MSDIKEVLKYQKSLQKRANKILEELSLLEILSKHGRPTIVGSMALSVMTRRDIDIEILIEKFNTKDIISIIDQILEKQIPRINFRIIDNQDKKNHNLPYGFYLGLDYGGSTELIEKFKNDPRVWEIDCWFLTEENLKGKEVTENIKSQLTPKIRSTILEIKSKLCESDDYKKKFSGLDIYRAVLDKKVSTVEEFLHEKTGHLGS